MNRSTQYRVSVALLMAILLSAAACNGGTHAQPEPRVVASSASSFFHHIIDPAPPGGQDCCTDVLALGDINGDGYLDVVIGAQKAKGAALVWYEYPTWQRHDIATGEFTTDGKAVDFDSDGDIDIVIGDETDGLLWFEQKQQAPFWVRHKIADGYVHDLVVADLDGHPPLDVVTADKKVVAVVYNGAAPSRTREIALSRAGEGLAVADVNGDGVRDIIYSNVLLLGSREDEPRWQLEQLGEFAVDTRVQVVDVNGDGVRDILLSGSEGSSSLAWFERRVTNGAAHWEKHLIGSAPFEGAHSLLAADFDLDGDIDVLVAEMSTSKRKRVQVLLNQGSEWRTLELATHGSHNMQAADLDGDGDTDLVGKNYSDSRFVELWENRAADLRVAAAVRSAALPSAWRYTAVDTARPPTDHKTFGLHGADLDRNGLMDLVTGGSAYLQVARGEWRRIAIAPERDVIHISSQRRNGWPVMLAVGPNTLEVVTARDSSGTQWSVQVLEHLPFGRTQGFAAGKLRGEGEYDFYFTRNTTLFRTIVSSADPSRWPTIRVRQSVQEEGITVADLDNDGDEDVLLVDGDGRRLLWLETTSTDPRIAHRIGASLLWIDRVAIADLNGDGRNDIVYTEESRSGELAARLTWLEAPRVAADGPWKPHVLAVMRSINSLGIADLDSDGRPDLVAAEHTDFSATSSVKDNLTTAFLNRGSGHFVVEGIEIGPHSSHLGALPIDIDGDGAFEVASIAWEQSCCVHLWKRVQPTVRDAPTVDDIEHRTAP